MTVIALPSPIKQPIKCESTGQTRNRALATIGGVRVAATFQTSSALPVSFRSKQEPLPSQSPFLFHFGTRFIKVLEVSDFGLTLTTTALKLRTLVVLLCLVEKHTARSHSCCLHKFWRAAAYEREFSDGSLRSYDHRATAQEKEKISRGSAHWERTFQPERRRLRFSLTQWLTCSWSARLSMSLLRHLNGRRCRPRPRLCSKEFSFQTRGGIIP